jgi:hypothetical protein
VPKWYLDSVVAAGPSATWDSMKLKVGWGLSLAWTAPDTATLTVKRADLDTAYASHLYEDTASAALARRDTLTAGWGITTKGRPVGDDTVIVNATSLNDSFPTWADMDDTVGAHSHNPVIAGYGIEIHDDTAGHDRVSFDSGGVRAWIEGVAGTGTDTTAFHHDDTTDINHSLNAKFVRTDSLGSWSGFLRLLDKGPSAMDTKLDSLNVEAVLARFTDTLRAAYIAGDGSKLTNLPGVTPDTFLLGYGMANTGQYVRQGDSIGVDAGFKPSNATLADSSVASGRVGGMSGADLLDSIAAIDSVGKAGWAGSLQGQDTTALKSLKHLPQSCDTASTATPTPNCDATDTYCLTALAVPAAFGAPTGTPVNGQKLIIRLHDDGTARALTWNAAYRSRGATLLTTTTPGVTNYIGLIWNATESKWDCEAAN